MESSAAQLGGRTAWWALTLVALTQAMSMVDRQVLAILLPRIKGDLQVGDAEMGLLYGTVFALFYALFSLPLGRLADGWLRTKLLAISITGWSLMTALGGMANSFGVLALSRLGVGVGEASVQPAGMSLLTDYFPKRMRGTVTAVIAASIALGLGAALWVGGTTADMWDRLYPDPASAPLGIKAWQAAFLVAAMPGFLLALLLWRLAEPVRGASDGGLQQADPHPFRASWETLAGILPLFNWANLMRQRASAGVWLVNLGGLALIITVMIGLTRWTDSLRKTAPPPLSLGGVEVSGNALQWAVTGFGLYVVLNWLQSLKLRDAPAYVIVGKTPSLLLLIAIAALQSIINYAVMAWSPSFIIKTYGASPAEVGLYFGMLVAVIGIIGPLIAGPLSDWVNSRIAGGRIYVTLASLTVSPLIALWAYQAETISSFYLGFSIYSVLLTMWIPPIYASFMDLVLPRMRGAVMSFYILTMTITGLGLGPYIVGLVSDVNGGDLRGAILSVYWLAPVLVVLVLLAVRYLPRDEASLLERARRAGEKI